MGIKGHPHQGEYPYQLHYARQTETPNGEDKMIAALTKTVEAARARGAEHASVFSAAEVAYLLGEVARLQSAYDTLTGEKFSDRVHAALKDRAEKAEEEVARLTAERDALKAEHQCCLDGDTAWAEKWRQRYESALETITRLREFKRQLEDYEQREAACCPEDMGFEEWIAILTKRREQAVAQLAPLREALDRLVSLVVDSGVSEDDIAWARAALSDGERS